MGNRGSKKRPKPSPHELEEALACLIANTRRVLRPSNLLTVAEWVDVACHGLGGLSAVGERIDLSSEMLRQFATAKRLSPPVKKLVAQRKIDRVDIVHRLSKFSAADQLEVARQVVDGRLSSNDVRAVWTLRRALPHIPVGKVIERVVESRDIKEYLAELIVPDGQTNQVQLCKRFAAALGDDSIRYLKVDGRVAVLGVNAQGRRRLQEAAKREGVTKREVIDRIASGKAK